MLTGRREVLKGTTALALGRAVSDTAQAQAVSAFDIN